MSLQMTTDKMTRHRLPAETLILVLVTVLLSGSLACQEPLNTCNSDLARDINYADSEKNDTAKCVALIVARTCFNSVDNCTGKNVETKSNSMELLEKQIESLGANCTALYLHQQRSTAASSVSNSSSALPFSFSLLALLPLWLVYIKCTESSI